MLLNFWNIVFENQQLSQKFFKEIQYLSRMIQQFIFIFIFFSTKAPFLQHLLVQTPAKSPTSYQHG